MLILNPAFSTAPRCQPAKPRAAVDVDIHDDLANRSEFALLKHSVEITLPSNYAPYGIVPPKGGKIRVTGIHATKKGSKNCTILIRGT